MRALLLIVLVCFAARAQGWFISRSSSNDRSFDSNGPGELQTSISNPFDALRARDLAQQSLRDAQRLYPRESLSDGEGDAFRHTLWNYRMSQDIGRSEAKKFGDAHERGNAYLQYSRGQEYGAGNSPGSRNMDLHNNHIGRNLQPRNGMSDIEVVQEAMRNGRTQNSPHRRRRRSADNIIW